MREEKGMTEEKTVDLSKLLAPYEGKWVAISGDKSKVLCVANSIEELLEKSKAYKEEDPIVLRVPDEHTAHLL